MVINPFLPINKTATLVVSQNNDVGREFKVGSKIVSLAPLPTQQWPFNPKDNLKGHKVGRFTVIGYAFWRPNNYKTPANSVRWVVKCTCGRYQIMTTKGVKNANPKLACVECLRNKK